MPTLTNSLLAMLLAALPILSRPAMADPNVVETTPDESRRAVAEMDKADRLREMNLHPERLQLPAGLTAAEAIRRAAPPPR